MTQLLYYSPITNQGGGSGYIIYFIDYKEDRKRGLEFPVTDGNAKLYMGKWIHIID